MVVVTQSVDSVVVSPAADTVALGDTLRLAAEAFDENSHAVEGAAFSWSSSNASVATVDGSGLVRGVGDGAAAIVATAGSAAGTSEITVESPDRAALVAFYEGTSGDFRWDNDTNWLSEKPLGTWHGVTTDEDGRVVELTLPNNGVWGPIPREFVHLQKLKRLDLSNNRVNGELPAEIGSLPDLEVLNLSENVFLGSGTPIPAAVGKLDKLQVLDLRGTRFKGEIPREARESQEPSPAGSCGHILACRFDPARVRAVGQPQTCGRNRQRARRRPSQGIGRCSTELLPLASHTLVRARRPGIPDVASRYRQSPSGSEGCL